MSFPSPKVPSQVGIKSFSPVAEYFHRARNCKRLWSPGIDFEESIQPAFVAWRAGTPNKVYVPARKAGNRFLGSLKGLQIRALDCMAREFYQELATPKILASRHWARICKHLWSPGIDSEKSIPPAYVAWRESTKNRVVLLARQAGNRFLVSLKGFQIRALDTGICHREDDMFSLRH